MKPYNFQWTRFYESNAEFENVNSDIELDLEPKELIICSTVIDRSNYSVLTTQKLVTKEKGLENAGSLAGSTDKLYGDFKGYKDQLFTFGQVQLHNGLELKYFIETGKASMIMIHGVRTFIRTQQMTESQMTKAVGTWSNQTWE